MHPLPIIILSIFIGSIILVVDAPTLLNMYADTLPNTNQNLKDKIHKISDTQSNLEASQNILSEFSKLFGLK